MIGLNRLNAAAARLAAAVIATTGLATFAAAAEKRVKAPVYSPPLVIPSWTGCYIGGNIGGGWANKSATDPRFNFGTHTADGVVGGGQIGCDYQAGQWVFGVQGMFDATSLKGENQFDVNNERFTTRVSSFVTATGRIGYAVSPSALLYVKGGGAWVRDNHRDVSNAGVGSTAQVTRSGWTVGGGLEWMFTSNWSAFVEFDHMNFGTRDVTWTQQPPFGTASFLVPIRQHVQVVMVGLNWRWGAPPVVAKY
jgi:outer membrane immunogenic protein